MNENSESEQLDRLLAQPALIADRGFSKRVEHDFKKLRTAHRNVFLVAGFLWLVLVFAVASPQALYADLSALAMTIDPGSIVIYLVEFYQEFDTSSSLASYISVATVILSLTAVIGMSIRT